MNGSIATTTRSGPGDVIGIHNGTIYNADYLFRRFKPRRFAEMDSELLFRLAARAARSGRMDVEWFKERHRRCRGQMTAVLASRLDPETVLVLKGNKPLELRTHRKHRAVLYASDPASWTRSWPKSAAGGSCLFPP